MPEISSGGGLAPLDFSQLVVIFVAIALAAMLLIYVFSPKVQVPKLSEAEKKPAALPHKSKGSKSAQPPSSTARAAGSSVSVPAPVVGSSAESREVSLDEGKPEGKGQVKAVRVRFNEYDSVQIIEPDDLSTEQASTEVDSFATVKNERKKEKKPETPEQKAARLERERAKKAAAKQQEEQDKKIAREMQAAMLLSAKLEEEQEEKEDEEAEVAAGGGQGKSDSTDDWKKVGKREKTDLGLVTRDSLLNLPGHGHERVSAGGGGGGGGIKARDSVLDLAAKKKGADSEARERKDREHVRFPDPSAAPSHQNQGPPANLLARITAAGQAQPIPAPLPPPPLPPFLFSDSSSSSVDNFNFKPTAIVRREAPSEPRGPPQHKQHRNAADGGGGGGAAPPRPRMPPQPAPPPALSVSAPPPKIVSVAELEAQLRGQR